MQPDSGPKAASAAPLTTIDLELDESPTARKQHDGHSHSNGEVLPADSPEPFSGVESQVDEKKVMRKCTQHLVPLFFALAVICYLDRANLAYAALEILEDLNFTETTYSIGAGLFFVGYALFQIPSNLLLVRFGAPTWLAGEMMVWGVLSALQALVRTAPQFYIIRFLLGVAECGTFPGIWYHLSLFYTKDELSVSYSAVASATALSQVIGGPIAALVLKLDGKAGLWGWQWLFILVGSPTVLFGGLIKWRLAPSPARARWLDLSQRDWLQQRQEAEKAATRGLKGDGDSGSASQLPSRWAGVRTDLRAIAAVGRQWRVWYIGVIWMLAETSIYGVVLFGPILIEAALTGNFGSDVSAESKKHVVRDAALSAVLFAPAAASMLLNAWHSKVTGERKLHAAITLIVGGIAFILLPLALHSSAAVGFLILIIAAAGVWGIHGPLMSWPATFLTGREAAAGIALINSLGALGGAIGPVLIGTLADRHKEGPALIILGALDLVAAGMCLVLVMPADGKAKEGPTAGKPGARTEALENGTLAMLPLQSVPSQRGGADAFLTGSAAPGWLQDSSPHRREPPEGPEGHKSSDGPRYMLQGHSGQPPPSPFLSWGSGVRS